MDYWPHLPPAAQLPLPWRVWAWWLRHGPKRSEGTLGGNFAFRLVTSMMRGEHALFTLHAQGRPALTIDLMDFESFHHALPVWYRGDAELAILKSVLTGGTYIDAGANYGTYALPIAYESAVRVIAVEPQPHLAAALRRSADVNALANFEVVEAALTDTPGTAVLAAGSGSGAASLRHERFGPDARKLTVRATTLDDLSRELTLADVRCLKLDVEGAEAAVLRGGRGLLERDRPVVVFEAGAAEPQDEVFAILRSLGYAAFWDHTSAAHGAPVPPRLDAALTNIVAVHERDLARVQEACFAGARQW